MASMTASAVIVKESPEHIYHGSFLDPCCPREHAASLSLVNVFPSGGNGSC